MVKLMSHRQSLFKYYTAYTNELANPTAWNVCLSIQLTAASTSEF
jgi:hypothetical protein